MPAAFLYHPRWLYPELLRESGESCNSLSRSGGSPGRHIYYQLTDAGYKVFFARITLEDKAGTEYEPYIFAALNSAKVMFVTDGSSRYADKNYFVYNLEDRKEAQGIIWMFVAARPQIVGIHIFNDSLYVQVCRL